MKKTLVLTKQQEINEAVKCLQVDAAAFQPVVDAYTSMCLPTLSGSDLDGLVNNTDIFLYDKLTGGNPAFLKVGDGATSTEIEVNKQQAMALLKKPEGYAAFMQALTTFKSKHAAQHIGGVARPFGVHWQLKYVAEVFSIEGDVVRVSEERIKAIEEMNKVYITSDKANRVLDFVNDVVAAYEKHNIGELKPSFPGTGDSRWFSPTEILRQSVERVDQSTGKWIPNRDLLIKDKEWAKLEQLN